MSEIIEVLTYGILDGQPVKQATSYIQDPEHPDAVSVKGHGKGWVQFGVVGSLEGAKACTEAAYEKAVAAQRALLKGGRAASVKAAATAWDERYARYLKYGWDEDDILAEIGHRPT